MHNTSMHFTSIISDTDRQIFETVNFVFISGVISIFGVVANVMNMVVFYKQGFNNAMTVSFFALAISDLCSLLTSLGLGVFVNPLLVNSDTDMIPHEMLHLTVGIPHVCFTRITSWITVFVTAERCLCIIVPLKVKQIITTRRTTVVVIVIYVLAMSCGVEEYSTVYFGYKFDVLRNRTMLGMVTPEGYDGDGLCLFLYSVLGWSSLVAVVTFTVILVVELNRKSRWRKTVTADRNQKESISSRERKAVKMVVIIATLLIVFNAPAAAVAMVALIEEEFTLVGKYFNEVFTFWSFAFVFDAMNASVNIFLYYYMNTKYRNTFRMVFDCCIPTAKL